LVARRRHHPQPGQRYDATNSLFPPIHHCSADDYPQVVLQLGFPITGACSGSGGGAAADAAAGSCNTAITTISAAAAAVATGNSTDAAEVCDIVATKCVDLATAAGQHT